MVALAVFYAAYFAYIGLYSPYFGPYLKSVGHSVDTIAWAAALMQSMRMVGPQAWGWLADYSSRRVRWMRLGALLGVVFAILLFFRVSEAWWVIAAAVLLNTVLSGLVPLSDTHAMLICRSDLGRYGRLRLWGSIGFIVTVMGFGEWALRHGLADFPVVLIASLVVTWLASMWMQESVHHDKSTTSKTQSFKALLQTAEMRLFWLASFCTIAAHGAFYGFYSLYLQHHGYSTSTIGLMWAIGVIAEVIFFWFQGRFFDRFDVSTWLIWGMAATAVRFFLVAAFPGMLWVIASAQVLHALTFAANHSATMAFLRGHCAPNLLARGQALYTGISYGLGGFLGTALAGRLWSWLDPSWAFWMASGFGVLALVCSVLMANSSVSRRQPIH